MKTNKPNADVNYGARMRTRGIKRIIKLKFYSEGTVNDVLKEILADIDKMAARAAKKAGGTGRK